VIRRITVNERAAQENLGGEFRARRGVDGELLLRGDLIAGTAHRGDAMGEKKVKQILSGHARRSGRE